MRRGRKRGRNPVSPQTPDVDTSEVSGTARPFVADIPKIPPVNKLKPLTSMMIQSGLMATSLAGTLLLAPLAHAGPEGGKVIEGEGTVTQTDDLNTHIDQLSQNLLMEFDSFDISADESVLITQPNASAWFVGNVVGGSPTAIFGNITANGQIALVNASGVIFGETASINAAGVFASALGIDAEELFEGDAEFAAKAGQGGYIINHGLISASVGGSVTLLGETVANSGVIMATMGQINLAGGSRAVVNFGPEQLIGIEVTDEVLENNEGLRAAVTNTGTLDAEGGAVMLTSSVSKSLFDHAINNEGVVKAKGATYDGGVIKLFGSGSSVLNTGTLDASSGAGRGGEVSISSDSGVRLEGESRIDVSGATGGGQITATGGTNLTVAASSTLIADATAFGDGGEIRLSADQVEFAGTATARGGSASGDGGTVEITANDNLEFSGSVDVSAPSGQAGELIFNVESVSIEEDKNIQSAALAAVKGNVEINAINRVEIADLESNTLTLGGSLSINVDGVAISSAESDAVGFVMSGADDTLSVNGQLTVSVTDGSVSANALIDVAGRVETIPEPTPLPNEPQNPGNNIALNANQGRIRIRDTAELDASADESPGSITLTAVGFDEETESGTVYFHGTATATSSEGVGGTVKLLGDRVGLFDETYIDASGAAGGGEILVGGNFQGSGPELNAIKTHVGSGANLVAEAIEVGEGGTVIVWADDFTRFDGQISVQGVTGGGFVEVSGKQILDYNGSVNLASSGGEAGTLLLDPTSITVVTTGTSTADALLTADSDHLVAFVDTPAASSISVSELTAFTTGEIILQATTGDVTFAANTMITDADVSLVVQTGGNIIINSGVTLSTTAGSIHLEADSPNQTSDGIGSIVVNATGSIETTSGDITLIAADFSLVGTGTNTGTITSTSGNIIIGRTQNDAIGLGVGGQLEDFELDLITTGGMMTIGQATARNSAGTGAGSILTASSVTIDEISVGTQDLTVVTSGDITLVDDGANPALSISSGDLELSAGGDITVDATTTNTDISTSGNITLRGENIGGTNSLDIARGVDGSTLTVDANGPTTTTNTIDIDAGSGFAFSDIVVTQAAALDDLNIENGTSNDVIDITGGASSVTLSDVDMATEAANFSYTLEEAFHSITVTNVDATTGSVTINGTGDVDVTNITAASGNVTITSSAGDIDESGTDTAVTNITTTGQLTLDAAGAIGAGSSNEALDIDVGVLVAESVGGLYIDNTDPNTSGLILSDVDTVSGNVEVATDDALTATDIDTTISGSITLSADAITVGNVTTAGGGAISLTATTGAIVESGTTTMTNNVSTAGLLTLDAVTGVGTAGANNELDIATASLDTDNTGAGGIFLKETDSVSISNITQSGTGNVSVEAGGTITVAGAVSTTDSSSITLNATTGSVLINKAISTVGGLVDIDGDAGVVSSVAGTDTGTITTSTADDDGSPADTAGAVQIDTNVGDITLDAAIIASGGSESTASTDADHGGAVTITAADGSIAVASINASGGAGSGTTVSDGGDGGAVALTVTDAMGTDTITVTGLISARGGDSTNDAGGAGGTVTITVNDTDANGQGAVSVNDIVTSGGDGAVSGGSAAPINVTSEDDGLTLTTGAQLVATAGSGGTGVAAAVSLTSGGSITDSSGGSQSAGNTAIEGASLTANAMNGAIDNGSGGALTSEVSSFDLDATGNINLANVGNVTSMDLDTAAGAANFATTGDLTIDSALTADSFDIDAQSVTVSTGNSVTADNGGIDIAASGASGITLANTTTVTSTMASGSVTLRADELAIGAFVTIAATSTGTVTIEEFTPGTVITLDDTDTTGLDLSDADLNAVDTDNLQIGSTDAGAISIDAAFDLTAEATTLRLRSAGAIADGLAGSLTVDTLDIQGQSVTLDNTTSASEILTLTGSSSNGDFEVVEADGFTTTGIVATGGALDLESGGTIVATGALSTTGSNSITLNATGTGQVDIRSTVSSSGGDIDIDGAGGVVSNASGDISTRSDNTDGVSVNGVSAGSVTIDVANADADINLAGDIDTSPTGTEAGAVTGDAGGAVTLTVADGSITVSGNIATSGGDSSAASQAGGVGGNVTLTVTDADGVGELVSVTGSITTSGGASTDSVTGGTGGIGGNVTITVTDAGNDATGGTVSVAAITTSGGAGDIALGTGGGAGTISITSEDGDLSFTGRLNAGTSSGNVTGASNSITLSATGDTGGSILEAVGGDSQTPGNAAIEGSSLTAIAGNGSIDNGAGALTTEVGSFDLDASGAINIANVGNVTAIDLDTTGGSATFNTTGDITIDSALTADSFDIDATSVTLSTGNSITSDNGGVDIAASSLSGIVLDNTTTITSTSALGSITLQADEISIGTSVTISATTTGTVTLEEFNPGTPITVGSGSAGLDLSDTDLNAIDTDILQIGSIDAGAFSIDAAIDVTAEATTLRLRSGGMISDGGSGVGSLNVDTLDVSGGAVFLTNSTTDSVITTLTGSATGGDFTVVESDGFTTTGVTANNGSVSLEAGGTITVTGAISATGTGTNNITIDATGTGSVDLQAALTSDGSDIDIDGAGGVVSNASGDISTRSDNTDGVSVNGVSAGSVTIDANSADADINLAGDINTSPTGTEAGAVTADAGGAVTLTAADGSITISGNVTTTGGDTSAASQTGGIGGNVTIEITDAGGAGEAISVTGAIAASGGASTNVAGGTGGIGGNVMITATDVGNDATGSTVGVAGVTTTGGAGDAGAGTGGGAGTISITSEDGALTLNGHLNAGSSVGNVTGVANTVALAATGDTGNAVIDGLNDTSIKVSGSTLSIDAVTGVGDSSTNLAIDTAVENLDIDNAGTGEIDIVESDDVTINNITQSGSGNVGVDAGGTITVAGAVSTADSSSITLNATTGSVLINKAISTVGGLVDIDGDAGVVSSVAGTDTGTITTSTADDDGSPADTAGAVQIDTNVGDITLDAAIIASGGSESTASTDADHGGAVTITAADGSIAVASINASGGAGSGTTVSDGGDGGAVALTVTDAMGTDTITVTGLISARGGDSTNDAGGAGGTVTITVNDTDANGQGAVSVNDIVTSGGDGAVSGGSAAPINVTSEDDGLTLTTGAQLVATAGSGGTGVAAAVSLTSGGSITDSSGGSQSAGNTAIEGASLTANAMNGAIDNGSGGALTSEVSSFDLDATGNINLANVGNVTSMDLDTAAGAANFATTGDLTIDSALTADSFDIDAQSVTVSTGNSVTADNGGIDIAASGASGITLANTTTVTSTMASGSVTLRAD